MIFFTSGKATASDKERSGGNELFFVMEIDEDTTKPISDTGIYGFTLRELAANIKKRYKHLMWSISNSRQNPNNKDVKPLERDEFTLLLKEMDEFDN